MRIEKNLKLNTPLIAEESLDDEDIIIKLARELNTPEGQKMADEIVKEILVLFK